MKIATRRKIVGGVVAAIFGTPVVALGVLIPQFGGVLALVGLAGLAMWGVGIKKIKAAAMWVGIVLGVITVVGFGIWGVADLLTMGPVFIMLWVIWVTIITKRTAI